MQNIHQVLGCLSVVFNVFKKKAMGEALGFLI